MTRVRSYGLDELAAAYRRVRAPATLAARLREPAAALARTPRSRWLLPTAIAAAGAIVLLIGVSQAPAPRHTQRVAIGLPSMSQIKPRTPATSLAGYRIPSPGNDVKIPTLPKTPTHKRKDSQPRATQGDREAQS